MTNPVRCERCGGAERTLCRVIDGVCENCRTAERRARTTLAAPVRPTPPPQPPHYAVAPRERAPQAAWTAPAAGRASARGANLRSGWAEGLLAAPESWVVLDTETTGGTTPEVIDLAVIDGAGTVLLTSCCRPTQPVNPFARKAHRITDRMLAQAPAFSAIYADLCALLAGRIVLAWNMPFDRAMLDQTCARYRHPPVAAAWQCAMKAYREVAGPREKYSLAAACLALGVAAPSHRALRDVQATLNVIRVLAGADMITWEA